jgi:fructose-1,6-bisphosphatase I
MDPLNHILDLIREACHKISNHIRHCNPVDMAKLVGNDNISGDHVKLLDTLSQSFLFESLLTHPDIYGIISEEYPDIYKTEYPDGSYIVAFDPLDGSSNIEFNITTGTIFGVYKLNDDKKIMSGRDIVLSGYCLYGGITEFVHTSLDDDKVKMMRLSEIENPPYPIYDNIIMPISGMYYSVNQAYMNHWLKKGIREGVLELGDMGYSQRYVGSMVADSHRVIMKGGLFMYPSDTKNKKGKIRLYYEAYPFAYLVERAGGICTNFEKNILDVEAPENIHEATPIILGSREEVDRIMAHLYT